ncbi:MAG TPA: hypothetical protein VEY71_01370 [Chitinophagales bacterium]|nr:hypothetical protein [Chitinophagales bacterium]
MKKLFIKNFLLALPMLAALNAFALSPSREYAVSPDDYGMKYKEVWINTEDNVKLYAWLFNPTVASKKYIIISDDGNGNMADNLEIIAQFLSAGYNVISYDYRGYGKSDEFKVNEKFFIYPQFVKDLTAVIEHSRKYGTQFDLYGIGIGAGLSVGVGANRTEVRRIIADGAYSTFEETKNRLKEKTGADVMMPLAYEKAFMEPKYALEEKGSHLYGVMFIVGQNDEITTPEDVKALSKLKSKITDVYVVPGAKNEANFSTNKNEYFNQIKKFLESHSSTK